MKEQSCEAGKCQNADKDSRHNDFKVAFSSVDRCFKEQEKKQNGLDKSLKTSLLSLMMSLRRLLWGRLWGK